MVGHRPTPTGQQPYDELRVDDWDKGDRPWQLPRRRERDRLVQLNATTTVVAVPFTTAMVEMGRSEERPTETAVQA